jgi:hypothetical protein
MRRRLFTILWPLSLILFLGVAALWLRGQGIRHRLHGSTANGTYWAFHSVWDFSYFVQIEGWPERFPFSYDVVPRSKSHSLEPYLLQGGIAGTTQESWEIPGIAVSRRVGAVLTAPDGTVIHLELWEKKRKPRFVLLSSWSVSIHHWTALTVFAILPAIRLLQVVRQAIRSRRRYEDGCCQSCGYDMQATPYQCPECGAIPDVESV